jgi:hypothetical protein
MKIYDVNMKILPKYRSVETARMEEGEGLEGGRREEIELPLRWRESRLLAQRDGLQGF